ncbi:MAG: HDOD domain-containing protein [Deltaproteobacteria bacterium]|nr:HDOD domain-containing protein [Deltaproteobacteria bacterium]
MAFSRPDYGRDLAAFEPGSPELDDACAWLADAADRAPESLPMLPQGARDALRLSFDPAASFDQVADAIQSDPALAAVTLKKANNFVFSRRCRSLADSLAHLGMQGVREVVLTAGTMRILRAPRDPEIGQWLRRRAEAAAHAAAVIELVCGSERGEAYTVGLLHDIGWMYAYGIIAKHRKSARPALFSDSRKTRVVVRRCHTELGARVVTQWGLPAPVADAVAAHHASDGSAGGIAAATVRAALETLDSLRVYPEGEGFEVTALAQLGLSGDAIAAVPAAVFGTLKRQRLVQDRRAKRLRSGGADRERRHIKGLEPVE